MHFSIINLKGSLSQTYFRFVFLSAGSASGDRQTTDNLDPKELDPDNPENYYFPQRPQDVRSSPEKDVESLENEEILEKYVHFLNGNLS